MSARLRIEKYSRKPILGRRQYHARIVSTHNGEELWRTSEGYSNRSERDYAINILLGSVVADAVQTVDEDDLERLPGL